MKNTFTNFVKNNTTVFVTLAAASTIFLVIAYNGSQMSPNKAQPNKPVEKNQQAVEETAAVLSTVTVQQVEVGSYQAEVKGFGEAKSRFELAYTSEVSGRVNWLSDAFEVGAQVKQGELLAKIDDSEYQQLLSEAQSTLASAELELLEEERQGEQARSEWERSGLTGTPNSSLVFRDPQLASAQAVVDNAKKALIKAKKDLTYTEIRAPFDGVITERSIQPGAHVSVGGSIATLYSTDRIEIEVPLSQQQWANLPADTVNQSLAVVVSDRTSKSQWTATVVREHQYIHQTTRQRSIVLAVDAPLANDNKLFPGMFVQATLTGKQLNNLWQLPSSALSQQGEIWLVDEQGLLNKYSAEVMFEQGSYIYVTPVLPSSSVNVVLRPLSNFNVGMKVSPQLSQKGA